MKHFQEFTSIWRGAYTKEQVSEYSTTIGDNRDHWPDTDLKGRVTIDLFQVRSFNEISRNTNINLKGATTVIMDGGDSFTLDIKYDDFAVLVNDKVNKSIYNNGILQ